MQKSNLYSIIYGAIFVIGLIILMNCLDLGMHEMSNVMRANGGSMDTNTYLIYLEQSIMKYRFAGSILAVLGGLGVLTTTSIKS